MAAPTVLGNEEEWPAPLRLAGGAIVGAHASTGMTTAKRWLWLLLMSSTLMLLRLQQEHLTIDFQQHQEVGFEDTAPPFKWEVATSLAGLSDFQATLLSPGRQSAAAFLPDAEGDVLAVLSLGRVGLLHNKDPSNASSSEGVNADGFSGIGRGFDLHLPQCPEHDCVIGIQRVPLFRRPPRKVPRGATCYRMMVGPTTKELSPLSASSRPLLCMRAQRISAVIPVANGANTTVFIVWDPSMSHGQIREGPVKSKGSGSSDAEGSGKKAMGDGAVEHFNAALALPFTCVAALELPDLQVRSVAGVDWAATALYDQTSASLVTVGYSGRGTLVAHSLDQQTLRPQRRYRLPLSSAWSIQFRGISDGFVLLLGAEPPHTGTVYGIDLQATQVYMVNPPVKNSLHQPQRSPRLKLPRASHVEELVSGGAMGPISQSFTAEDGPCSIVAGTGPVAAVAV